MRSLRVADLERAIENSDVNAVRQLLGAGVDPNSLIPDLGVTLMAVAIVVGEGSVIGVMSGFGGDIEQVDEDGRSALGRSASSGDGNSMLGVLISCGAEVNGRDKRGWTPLHNAAVHGYQENVSALIMAGADTRLQTDSGLTAGDLARQNNHWLEGLSE